MLDTESLVKVHNIPLAASIRSDQLVGTGQDVLRELAPFFKKYHAVSVLHGPWTSSRLFLGYEKIRQIPPLVDIVCTPDALEDLVLREGFRFDSEEHQFVSHRRSVIFRLDGGMIQDWNLSPDFFTQAIQCTLNGVVIPVTPAEYTLALVLRHACHAGRSLLEDEIQDCVNLVAAPLVREGLPQISLEQVSDLTLRMAGYRAIGMLDSLLEGVSYLSHEGVQEKAGTFIEAWQSLLEKMVELQV
jgi:hypothetical protein